MSNMGVTADGCARLARGNAVAAIEGGIRGEGDGPGFIFGGLLSGSLSGSIGRTADSPSSIFRSTVSISFRLVRLLPLSIKISGMSPGSGGEGPSVARDRLPMSHLSFPEAAARLISLGMCMYPGVRLNFILLFSFVGGCVALGLRSINFVSGLGNRMTIA